ncbi:MAG: bifunctional hydroxymethylpyrimidine kinase/phosphomethylpyrimidine kinase [Caulobacteraceae bacterium]
MGGGAQVVALARMGIDTVLVPTVLYGRHPGLGPPGGGAVEDAVFRGMLEGIVAEGAASRADAILTGYFGSADQVTAAASLIGEIKRSRNETQIVVDPVIGDAPDGLYVPGEVAEAIAERLITLADLVAPNAWELRHLTGEDDPRAGARRLGKPLLASSVDLGAELGVAWVGDGAAWLATHPRIESAPKGTGDRLTALFTGARLLGHSPYEALRRAVEAIAGDLPGAEPVRIGPLP